MNKEEFKLLTPHEFSFFIMGFVIGPAFLRLPNALVETGRQDSWIAAIIAVIYPLFVVLISSYIIKKHPKENILVLSKKYFGNLLGNIFNFIFMLQFVLYIITVTLDFMSLTETYIVAFLSPLKISAIIISLSAYTSYKGLKVLGKTNELATYSFLILLFSATALEHGNILNIKPVFGSGFLNILKATKDTSYFYTGWEAMLLFHPFVDNTKDIKKSTLKALGITVCIWVWTIFITIFYLGVNIVPKNYWSFVMVFESINIPIINNFRYIFMFAWVLIIFRMVSNYYFTTAFFLNSFTKIDIKKLCIIIYPFVLYACVKVPSLELMGDILSYSTATFIIFNLIFIISISLFVLNKSKKAPTN